MRIVIEILRGYRKAVHQRFLEVVGKDAALPPHLSIPTTPEEALRLGMQLGRREGYSEGLVDGTQLGLDVGLESVDAMLRQPVIFGCAGSA